MLPALYRGWIFFYVLGEEYHPNEKFVNDPQKLIFTIKSYFSALKLILNPFAKNTLFDSQNIFKLDIKHLKSELIFYLEFSFLCNYKKKRKICLLCFQIFLIYHFLNDMFWITFFFNFSKYLLFQVHTNRFYNFFWINSFSSQILFPHFLI